MPFTARQKKRLEKEGAPLAVRRFPRHPPPPHPTSTPNRLHVPDSPRRGDAPQGQTRHPTAGPQKPGGLGGGIRCARTDPISSRGQRKNPLRSRRDEERGGQYSNCCTARRIGGGGGERREEGMGTATPPGQGQPREREGCKGVVIRENEGRRGRKKINLKRKGGSRSGWDRLLAVSSLPEAGSNGHRPARRRGGPGGMVWLLLPPSFLHRDGSHPPRDPTPPRTSPDFLSLPPPPPPNLHTPPRVRPTAATLPAPLTDFMAEAMSSYLSACSARRARCSSCSRSPIAASVVTAGLGTLRPSEREEGGGRRRSAPRNARAVRVGNLNGAATSRSLPQRPLGSPQPPLTRRPRVPGDGWRLALTDRSRAGNRALAASPPRRVQLAPLLSSPARSLALLPPPAPAR